MISRIIDYSARNKFIVFLLVFFLSAWGYWAMPHTARRHPRPLRHPGHHLHRLDGAKPGPCRRPDHLPHFLDAPCRPQGAGGARILLSRKLLHLRHLRRRDRYLLGEKPDPRVPPGSAEQASRPRSTRCSARMRRASAGDSPTPSSMRRGARPCAASLASGLQLKLALESVPGVSQVASVGGFVKQYQITVDPNRLAAYNIPITKVMEAVRKSNLDVEGRVIEFSGVEYMVRGRGYHQDHQRYRRYPVGTTGAGTPIYLQERGEHPARARDTARAGRP